MTSPKQTIPDGLCQCGCGRPTTLAIASDANRGLVRGKPRRFIAGHQRQQHPTPEEAMPFKIEGVYCRLIPLSQGQFTIVDANDYAWLMQWKWHAWKAKDGNWYARRGESRKTHTMNTRIIAMHRQILGLTYGDGILGDHKDCWNTLDNRRKNLRVADRFQNAANQSWEKRRGKSGCRGVYWSERRKMWIAVIFWRNVKYRLGEFTNRLEASAAYNAKAVELHGEFARF